MSAVPATPIVPSALAARFDEIRALVDLAETYAADGAPMSAMQNLVDAIAAIRSMIEPAPDDIQEPMPLDDLVATVTAALLRRTPHEVASVPWVAKAIGAHEPSIRAMGEVAGHAEERYRAKLVEWITRDR